MAIGLDCLAQLARIEPVPLALRAAIDAQVRTQERNLLQLDVAARAVALRERRLMDLLRKQPLQLLGLPAEQEDFAAIEPDPLAGLAHIDKHAPLGGGLDQRRLITTGTF